MAPEKEVTPHFQFASWRVPQFPRAIEYPVEVLEEIRAFACDELLQISPGSNPGSNSGSNPGARSEAGGILFGTRQENLIRILTWRPIACEHAQGEELRLSNNDRMNLAVQLEMARQTPDLKDLRPLGWFVSHWRGDVGLSASDLEIYNGFFPEAWQVTLAICPQRGGVARAGFFVRETGNQVKSEASYHAFDLRPLRLPPIAANRAAAEPVAMNTAAPRPEAKPRVSRQLPPTTPVPPPVPTVQSDPDAANAPVSQDAPVERTRRAAPRPAPGAKEIVAPTLGLQTPPTFSVPTPPAPSVQSSPTPGLPPNLKATPSARSLPVPHSQSLRGPDFDPGSLPSFEVIEEPLPSHERWLWAIPIVLALGIAGFMLNQRRAVPPNAIALRAVSEAQAVQLAWDANSRAIRNSDHADMQIDDGGNSSHLSLSNDQLRAGKMSYLPQSADVGVSMTVYPANGDPIHDSTRLVMPSFTPPPRTPKGGTRSTSPPPAPDQSAAQQAELQQEIRRLKDDLGKERARASELQNLVRILQNRLGISGPASEPEKRP
jgi:hypothetical protein